MADSWCKQVLEGFGVSEVVVSGNPNFKPGDHVTSWTQWEEYTVIAEGKGLKPIDRSVAAPLSYYVGALGMPGFTAYVGLHEVLKPKKGETIFVSAASGAVGQMVGQLAREAGLYVVGSAGSQDKVSKQAIGDRFFGDKHSVNVALTKCLIASD